MNTQTRRLAGLVAGASMGLAFIFGAGNAWPDPPTEGGNATINIEPADGLAATDSVLVDGSRFLPSRTVGIRQCSGSKGAHARQEGVCSPYLAVVVSDANGDFGPVAVSVARTFSGTAGRDQHPATHTCLPTDDCTLYVYSPALGEKGPGRWAWREIGFAP